MGKYKLTGDVVVEFIETLDLWLNMKIIEQYQNQ